MRVQGSGIACVGPDAAAGWLMRGSVNDNAAEAINAPA
jgi:hypothetical protein